MKKSMILAIAFLLLPALSAGAASSLQRKHHAAPTQQKAKPAEPAPVATPPVTRLPIAPDTFRA